MNKIYGQIKGGYDWRLEQGQHTGNRKRRKKIAVLIGTLQTFAVIPVRKPNW